MHWPVPADSCSDLVDTFVDVRWMPLTAICMDQRRELDRDRPDNIGEAVVASWEAVVVKEARWEEHAC